MADRPGDSATTAGRTPETDRLAAWRDTARLLARTTALGFLLGGAALFALVLAGRSAFDASTLAFSLAALVFGFGLTVWAGTLLLGESLAAAHQRLESSTDWTAADSRQAMAVLTAIGGGAMLGVVVATAVVDALG